METSIIDTSNPPDVVIDDNQLKRFCRGLWKFFSNGYTDDLGTFIEDKSNLFAHVNSDGFKVWLMKGKCLQFVARPFDCEEYTFVFLHDVRSACMVLGGIYGDNGRAKIDDERKRTALVDNVLKPALANLGF